jgi:Rps23 Pro-64 3,4-dihydroxylase Tpa1-like proline 4-hydroxylase
MTLMRFDLEGFVTHIASRLANADWRDEPYGHAEIDGFLPEMVAETVRNDCKQKSLQGYVYDSAIERKEASNQWNDFTSDTYAVFAAMNHPYINAAIQHLTGLDGLFLDAGLHGGGIHRTKAGGHLNLHIDYAIHPKLFAERRLNLIIYLNPEWRTEWLGQLELWAGDGKPEHFIKKVEPGWNKAVLFATGDNSWHGFPEPLRCPTTVTRTSLAMYYCSLTRPNTSERYKARFVPSQQQANDPAIVELCERRADATHAESVYRG